MQSDTKWQKFLSTQEGHLFIGLVQAFLSENKQFDYRDIAGSLSTLLPDLVSKLDQRQFEIIMGVTALAFGQNLRAKGLTSLTNVPGYEVEEVEEIHYDLH